MEFVVLQTHWQMFGAERSPLLPKLLTTRVLISNHWSRAGVTRLLLCLGQEGEELSLSFNHVSVFALDELIGVAGDAFASLPTFRQVWLAVKVQLDTFLVF